MQRPFTTTLLISMLIVLSTAGCLSAHYSVSRAELDRLARVRPDVRASRVVVTQRWTTQSDPKGADDETIVVVPGRTVSYGEAWDRGQASRPPRSIGQKRVIANPSVGGSSKSTSTGQSSSTSSSKGDKSNPAAIVLGAVAVVAVIGFVVAASEAARFEGISTVSPSQPVHLLGPGGGELGWVPLDELDPAHLNGVARGVISDKEGAVHHVARFPLRRRGFAFDMTFGSASMNQPDRRPLPTFATRMMLGYFPIEHLGILGGASFGFATRSGTLYAEIRPQLELQAIPFYVGDLHFGLYGNFGYSYGNAPGVDGFISTSSLLYGGGGILQYELSTFAAMTLRGGVTALPAAGHGIMASPEVLLGFSVY